MSEGKAKYNKEVIVIKYFDEEICMHPFSEVESIDEKGCRVCYKNGSYAYYIGKPVRIGKTPDYIGLIKSPQSKEIDAHFGVITISEDELCNFTTVCDGAVAGEDVTPDISIPPNGYPIDTLDYGEDIDQARVNNPDLGPARVMIDSNGEGLEMVRKDVCNPDISDGAMSKGNVYVFGMTFTPRDIVLQGGDDYYGECRGVLLCLSKEDTLESAIIRSERIAKEKEDEAREIQATIDKMANKIELNDGFALLVRQENNTYQILEIKKGHYENVGKSCIARESSLVFIDSAPGVGSFYAVDYDDIIGFIKE